MAHAGEVEIVDAHLHLINLTDLVYPWIESRKPALTALLPNLACEFGAVDGVAEAVRVQGCADRVVFQTPFIAAVQLESDDLPSFLARYRDLRIVRAIGKWMAVSISARGDSSPLITRSSICYGIAKPSCPQSRQPSVIYRPGVSAYFIGLEQPLTYRVP